MIITGGINKIDRLPSPALGLLPAVHDATVTEFDATPVVENGQTTTPVLPAPEANSAILVTGTAASLPAFGSWPAQRVQPGRHIAIYVRLFYIALR